MKNHLNFQADGGFSFFIPMAWIDSDDIFTTHEKWKIAFWEFVKGRDKRIADRITLEKELKTSRPLKFVEVAKSYKTVSTHFNIIDCMMKNDLLRTYSYFLMFKSTFSSSMIIGGKKSRLINRIKNVSEKTIRQQLNIMIGLKWIKEDDDGNYILISKEEMLSVLGLRHIKNKKRTTIDIHDYFTVSHVISAIQARVIENYSRQKLYSLLNTAKINKSKKKIRRKKRNSANDNLSAAKVNAYRFSCSKLGRIFSVSKSSGKRIKTMLSKRNHVEIVKGRLKSVRMSYQQFLFETENVKRNNPFGSIGYFWSKGIAYAKESDILKPVYSRDQFPCYCLNIR